MMLATVLLASMPGPIAVQESPSRAELEAELCERLSGVRLVGFTTIDGREGLVEDSYTLTRVSPASDGRLRFEATIEFGERPVPMAMALPVEWAGDTPVITVRELSFPLMGTYSARVLFLGDRYAGVWTGDGYGGEMFGRIVPLEDGADADEDSAPDEPSDAGDDDEAEADEDEAADAVGVHWPTFRGPAGNAVARGYPAPTEWDVESGAGVRWTTELPGLAHSTPAIWGDRLFVTTAIRLDGEQELRVGLYGDIQPLEDSSSFSFDVLCLDKTTGRTLWSVPCWKGLPKIARHPKGSHAASSPAVDDERVVAFFGSEGLYCYDHDGNVLWRRFFGVLDSGYFAVPDAQWGFASSPVLADDVCYVQCDVQGQSFVCALDAATGDELWRTERDEVPTWGTPTVDDERSQLVCNGWKHIGGYDLASGAEIWRLAGGGDIPVPTPVVAHDLVFITNAHGRMAPILAIDATAEGTLTMDPGETPELAWASERGGNYMQTPVVYGDEAYFCADTGVLACYDARTGAQHYRERLGAGRSGFTGSGLAADGKLYFTSEEGEVHVVRAGPEFELLAVNPLGEECMSSPVASEGVLFFRARRHLFAVGG